MEAAALLGIGILAVRLDNCWPQTAHHLLETKRSFAIVPATNQRVSPVSSEDEASPRQAQSGAHEGMVSRKLSDCSSAAQPAALVKTRCNELYFVELESAESDKLVGVRSVAAEILALPSNEDDTFLELARVFKSARRADGIRLDLFCEAVDSCCAIFGKTLVGPASFIGDKVMRDFRRNAATISREGARLGVEYVEHLLDADGWAQRRKPDLQSGSASEAIVWTCRGLMFNVRLIGNIRRLLKNPDSGGSLHACFAEAYEATLARCFNFILRGISGASFRLVPKSEEHFLSLLGYGSPMDAERSIDSLVMECGSVIDVIVEHEIRLGIETKCTAPMVVSDYNDAL